MLKASRQRKSAENALLLLVSSTAALPSRPGPPPLNPAPSWPGDGAEGPGGRVGGWQDAGAARPAAARASGRRRRSCHLLARPPGAPLASSRRLGAGGLAAPAHRSPRPQLPVLTPARALPPAPPPPPLQRGQRCGAPQDRPPLSGAHRRRCCPAPQPTARGPARGRPRPGDGDPRLSIPGRALGAKAGWGGGRKGGGGVPDSPADPGSCP